MVIFTGKVSAKAMGKYKLGLALGTFIFMAAGTAIYDAEAAKMAKMNLLETSVVTHCER